MDFYDYDPDAKQGPPPVSPEEHERVKEGFRVLIEAREQRAAAEHQRLVERQRARLLADQKALLAHETRPLCNRLGYAHCSSPCQRKSCPERQQMEKVPT